MKYNTVDVIVEKDLCCGCGTCEPICPKECIKLTLDSEGQYKPVINQDLCIDCGLCLKVCPNQSIGYKSKIEVPKGVISGYSKDEELRFNAASGGLTTQLLMDGLESGRFDAVVVMSGDIPSMYSAIIATSKNDILKAKGSKYVQIPNNRILRKLEESSYKRICFVGLPCHIRGLDNYVTVRKKFADRIVMKLALVCGQTLKHTAIEKQLSALNVNSEELKQYTFRGNGWPGGQTIQKERETVFIKYTDKRAMGGLFASLLSGVDACIYCEDHFGKQADISFCDTWHSPQKGKCDGLTSALCYSEKGKKFVEEMAEVQNNIFIEEDDFKNILNVQGHMKPTPQIVYLLKKKLGKHNKIEHTSEIQVNAIAKFKALFYVIVVGAMKQVNIKYYPVKVLALSRIFKKLLR